MVGQFYEGSRKAAYLSEDDVLYVVGVFPSDGGVDSPQHGTVDTYDDRHSEFVEGATEKEKQLKQLTEVEPDALHGDTRLRLLREAGVF